MKGSLSELADIDPAVLSATLARCRALYPLDAFPEPAIVESIRLVWTSVQKMKRRDEKYARAREALFTTPTARAYFRELSIDELPGLTSRETLAACLALCEVLGMPVQFVAPAFGFQKNLPFEDNALLRSRIGGAYEVTRRFGASIGFHSGSGKSAENYRVCAEVCGTRLEIKTSGRFTYEFGRALFDSPVPSDRALFDEW